MPVRRFKRYFRQMRAHRAATQIDMLDVIIAPNMSENDLQRLRNSLLRIIDPDAGKRIIKI